MGVLQKRLTVQMTALAVAIALAMPALAQAAPQFHINGNLVGATQQSAVGFGTLTLSNSRFGEFKCKVLMGWTVGNESEKGVGGIEQWHPFQCTAKECQGSALVTPEGLELIEETHGTEKIYSPKIIKPNMPWPLELLTFGTGKAKVNTRKMKMYLVCPQEGLEVPFNGNLEPHLVNGLKNGLSPSHLVFEGKGGSTSWLSSPAICGGCESEEDNLYLSGELTVIGASEELVTAE